MKITVEFDNEHQARAYLTAEDYYYALFDTLGMFRYSENIKELTQEEMYERFFEILGEYGIDLDAEVEF